MLKKRTIKSFVNRKGRESSSDIEAIQKAKDAGVLIFPKGNVIRFKKNFKNENDVVIDIGFGNGNLLYEIAKKNSDINFVGIEVYKHGVGKLLKKIIQTNIKNINVINDDANEILEKNIEDNSVKGISIFFPDPWPKKKHKKRRLVNSTFLELMISKVKEGGFIKIVTDIEDYANDMKSIFNYSNGIQQIKELKLFNNRDATKYELKGIEKGHSIFDLSYKIL